MYSILYSVLHCMYCTWYDTCTRALTLRGQPHSRSVPPVSGAQLAGGSAGRAAGAPLPLPGPPRRSPGTGRRWGDEEKLLLPPEGCLLGLSARALPAAAALRVQKGGGLGSAAPQSARRDADGAAAGGALGKGLHQNRSFLRAVWILKPLHQPHEKGLNEEFVKVASCSKLGKSESSV